jgi:aspartate carbamoyltransferase regulatory subunit
VNFGMRERNHAFLDHRETRLKSKRVIIRKKDVEMRCLFCDFFIK